MTRRHWTARIDYESRAGTLQTWTGRITAAVDDAHEVACAAALRSVGASLGRLLGGRLTPCPANAS